MKLGGIRDMAHEESKWRPLVNSNARTGSDHVLIASIEALPGVPYPEQCL